MFYFRSILIVSHTQLIAQPQRDAEQTAQRAYLSEPYTLGHQLCDLGEGAELFYRIGGSKDSAWYGSSSHKI